MKIKLTELIAEAMAWSFAPVFLIKMWLNNHNCIWITEPIGWVRITELILAIYVIIFLGKKIIREAIEYGQK